MKTTKYLLMIAAVATIAFTACTQDDDAPTLPTPEPDERPISFAATMPVKAWGVESKAAVEPEWTLYYPLKDLPYQDASRRTYLSSTSSASELTASFVQNTTDTYSLTARYKYSYPNPDYDSNQSISDSNLEYLTEHRDLVWSMIEKTIDTNSDGVYDDADFYLTAKMDGVDYWATTTGHYDDDLSFDMLKPRKARFIIKLTVVDASFTLADNSFTFSLAGVKTAVDEETATNDNNIKNQPWPCSSTDWTNVWNINRVDNVYTVTANEDFAPQTVGNLTITYGSYSWEINLSNVDVTGTGLNSKKANEWGAGDYITLNVNISYRELGNPSITVESFTNGSSHYFNGEVQP